MTVSPALTKLIDYLGALGARWGLPADSCRVHGYLYVTARPATDAELANATGLTAADLAQSLAWLVDYRLVTKSASLWRTDSDPWDLLLRALEERRRREIDPALDLLRGCQRDLQGPDKKVAGAQVGKLIALAEDLAAIDMQARRLSPHTLRRLVGFGGRVGRLLDRTLGDRKA